MHVRRILVTCLAGAVGAVALPAGADGLPAALAQTPMRTAGPVTASVAGAVLAPSLQQLRGEVNARWPYRSRASDGWLGDVSHQSSRSDHNPVGHPNGPSFGTPGSVHALDITASGIDTSAVLSAVIGDSRVWYVIYNRTIWSRTYGWAAQPYFGAPHTSHIHISIRSDNLGDAVAAENDTRGWLGGGAGRSIAQASTTTSTSASSLSTGQVQALQQALIARGHRIPAGATGVYGSQTIAAVAAFQRSQGWSGSAADGLAGPRTLSLLGVGAAGSATFVPAAAKAPVAPAPAAAGGSYAPGASGAHVAALQQALIARGFAIPAGATGLFGGQTQAAVAAFQRSQGWSGSYADGIPGPGTLARLGIGGAAAAPAAPAPAQAAPAPAAGGSYSPGASGAHVAALQQALIARGFAIPAGATGLFGGQTQAAVAAFQRSQGWSGSYADGIPGPGTLARLGIGGAAAAPAAPAAPAPAAGGSYGPGVSGAHVTALQQALIARGFAIAAGATGLFGGQTQAAVAAFQRSQGWSGSYADGIPGPGTLARLGLR